MYLDRGGTVSHPRERRKVSEPPDSAQVDAETLVRTLGYDPTQLTPKECDELAEILAWEKATETVTTNASTL